MPIETHLAIHSPERLRDADINIARIIAEFNFIRNDGRLRPICDMIIAKLEDAKRLIPGMIQDVDSRAIDSLIRRGEKTRPCNCCKAPTFLHATLCPNCAAESAKA